MFSRFKYILPRSLVEFRLPPACSGQVLFTFDDGPHPELTPRFLDLLDMWTVKAIFFIVGKTIPQAPHLLQEILQRGHTLGNHSFSHRELHQLPVAAVLDDIQQCQRAIFDNSGFSPSLMRLPYGYFSINTFRALHRLHLRNIHWSRESGEFLSGDDDYLQKAKTLVRTISTRDIILSHDNNPTALEILRTILPELQRQGFNMHAALQHFQTSTT